MLFRNNLYLVKLSLILTFLLFSSNYARLVRRKDAGKYEKVKAAYNSASECTSEDTPESHEFLANAAHIMAQIHLQNGKSTENAGFKASHYAAQAHYEVESQHHKTQKKRLEDIEALIESQERTLVVLPHSSKEWWEFVPKPAKGLTSKDLINRVKIEVIIYQEAQIRHHERMSTYVEHAVRKANHIQRQQEYNAVKEAMLINVKAYDHNVYLQLEKKSIVPSVVDASMRSRDLPSS